MGYSRESFMLMCLMIIRSDELAVTRSQLRTYKLHTMPKSFVRSLLEGDLLEGIDHFEALLVVLGQDCVAWSIDHQRLHARGKRSFYLFDVVAKEENRTGRYLHHKS